MNAPLDVVIIGAGAAGMMCALTAAQRGRSVLVLDHSAKLAEKIRISGGGRCNFTHLDTKPERYLSANPHFCRSALARYTPRHFLDLMAQHDLSWHEKEPGQLFCDQGSEAIIAILKTECDESGILWRRPCTVQTVTRPAPDRPFRLTTSAGVIEAHALVVATGGLSIPKIGATPFGYQLAEQFGLPIVKLHPGLVPLSFAPQDWQPYSALSGVSLPAEVRCNGQRFRDDLLFTHRGLSGPAILQISSYWQHGQPLSIDLAPQHDLRALLAERQSSRTLLVNVLADYLPRRLAECWLSVMGIENTPINQFSIKRLRELAEALHDWRITPSGTLGYAKAEITCGGVDTRALSSKTMEATTVPGLYFIGEVVDVTGQLGGYNFQWAWASGHAAGMAV